MSRRGKTDIGQGDFFLPGGYDRAAVENERSNARFLRKAFFESRALRDPSIYESAMEKVAFARDRVEWARASYGSLTYFLHLMLHRGLGYDGVFDPKNNGTIRQIYRQEKHRRGRKRR